MIKARWKASVAQQGQGETADRPGAYAKATLRGTVTMFRESGSYDMELRLPESIRSVAGPLLKAGGSVVLLVDYVGTAAWCVLAWRGGRRRDLLALAAPVAAYLLVALGPESYSRFRVPLQPLLIVLAATADTGWIDRVRSRRDVTGTPPPESTPSTLDHA